MVKINIGVITPGLVESKTRYVKKVILAELTYFFGIDQTFSLEYGDKNQIFRVIGVDSKNLDFIAVFKAGNLGILFKFMASLTFIPPITPKFRLLHQ